MYTKEDLRNAENLPEAMQGTFDQEWTDIGPVKGGGHTVRCVCGKCSRRPSLREAPEPSRIAPFRIVTLKPYKFAMAPRGRLWAVWFGSCESCGGIFYSSRWIEDPER